MSAGSVFGTILNIIVLSGMWCVIYKMFRLIIAIANGVSAPSMDMLNLLTQLDLILVAGPVIIIISLVANHVVNTANEQNLGV